MSEKLFLFLYLRKNLYPELLSLYYDFFPSTPSTHIRNVCVYFLVSVNLIVMLCEYVCVEKKAMQRPALLATNILGRWTMTSRNLVTAL